MIHADVIAVAIVEACRATGEDPIDCAMGVPAIHARHYALHALCRVYPDVEGKVIARFVGAPAKPNYFFSNSKKNVAWPSQQRIFAKWWAPLMFRKVVDAVFAAAEKAPPGRADAFLAARERLAKPPAPEVAPKSPIADKISNDPRPRARDEMRASFPQVAPGMGKKSLQDMLADAVRNTAALPIPKGSADE